VPLQEPRVAFVAVVGKHSQISEIGKHTKPLPSLCMESKIVTFPKVNLSDSLAQDPALTFDVPLPGWMSGPL
jgi:hypothetical protein